MGDKSAIEWTDATWSPVTGCTKVSAGCKFCYAERVTERFGQQKFTDIVLHPERLDQPLRWRRPRRIFVNSMSDLFHEKIPQTFIAEVFTVMHKAEHHTFQVLTKRADRMMQILRRWDQLFAPARHIWLGVSVENQEQADKRIPMLLQTPAAVRFLSVEPLLEPVNLSPKDPTVEALSLWYGPSGFDPEGSQPVRDRASWLFPKVDWVIVGGESGGPPERALVEPHGQTVRGFQRAEFWRPKDEALDWVRALRDQCVAAGVPWFFKQWGGPTPKSGGRLLDGREWNDYPS